MNTLTLESDDENVENQFMLTSLPFSIRTFRIICVIAFFVQFFYFLKEYFWEFHSLVYLRVLLFVPFYAFAYLLSKRTFIEQDENNFQKLAFSATVFAVLIQLLIAWMNLSVHTEVSHTIPIIIYSTYMFFGIKFKHLLYYIGPYILFFTFLLTWFLMDYTINEKLDVTIIVTINFFIATFAKYNVEYFIRKNFIKREKQKEQNNIIARYNSELSQQKILYSGLAERSDDLITIRSLEGKLQYVSPASMDMLQYFPDELIGIDEDKLIHPKDYPQVIDKRKRFGQHEKIQMEYRMLNKSGQEVWVEAVWIPVVDENGQIKSVQNSIRNISSKKKLELDLKKSKKHFEHLNKQKDKFFSIISHDLRGPFNNLISLIDILEDELNNNDDKQVESVIKYLKTCGQNTYNLLENLLTWANIQMENSSVNKVNCNVKSIVSENVNLLRPIYEQKNITVSVDIRDDLILLVDMNMLKTVLRNLLSNAIKFSNRGDNIEIYYEPENDKNARIVVKDEGVGIPKDRIAKLFTLNGKSSTLGTEKEKGTGLGLVICYDFITLNGCTMSIESEVNIGTKISILLPKA